MPSNRKETKNKKKNVATLTLVVEFPHEDTELSDIIEIGEDFVTKARSSGTIIKVELTGLPTKMDLMAR